MYGPSRPMQDAQARSTTSMALKGDLNNVNLGDIFQTLAMMCWSIIVMDGQIVIRLCPLMSMNVACCCLKDGDL